MSEERACTICVVMPDQQLYFCIYERPNIQKMADEIVLDVSDDVEAEVEKAGDRVDMLVRQYMQHGDPEKTLPEVAASTFRLLSVELPSEVFAQIDHMIVYHDVATGDMMAEGFEDVDAWDRKIESTMIDCEVRSELGLPVPRPNTVAGPKPTLH